MTRKKPVEPVYQNYGQHFDQLCVGAERFWPVNVLPAGEQVIVVDLLMQDIRLAIRNLTVANAIRRFTPARIVALVGPAPDWLEEIWQYYDLERFTALARAYGVTDFIDLGALVCDLVDGRAVEPVIDGRPVPLPAASAVDPALFAEVLDATVVRIARVPRVTAEIRAGQLYQRVAARSEQYCRVYDALFAMPTAAFVTSHIDYSQWGLGTDSAMRARVPVVHVQATGSLKAYTLFPDHTGGEGTFRMQVTRLIAQYFEDNVWRHRRVLRRAAEVTAWRAKVNLGRPSWWRGGGAVSQLEYRTHAERAAVRVHALARLGFDPDKPVVTVFNHAVSDAVRSNHEIFDDLADWIERTAEHARAHPEANWLFLDHPSQANYDGTEHFEALARRHADVPHMVFRQSMELSKNVLMGLMDLVVTVRGSASNEYPAYGIPAVQAGWSEWSHCGFSMRADSVEEYWSLLDGSIGRLLRGEEVITAEQVERARLWLWFYRSATDVPSPVVPPWETGQGEALCQTVRLAMTDVESDGDPAFASTRRAWRSRAPFLLRHDLAIDPADLAEALAPVAGLQGGPEAELRHNPGIETDFDDVVAPLSVPAQLTSGAAPELMMMDGLARGQAIIGRGWATQTMTGLKLDSAGRDVRVSVRLSLDNAAGEWWATRTPEGRAGERPWRPRVIAFSCQGAAVGSVTLTRAETAAPAPTPATIHFEVPAARIDPDSLLVIEMGGAASGREGSALPSAMVGVRVDGIQVEAV
ncbi:MAG: hypothetical protein LWW86_12610 [Micrococcales bacterium]|nr:hypothetical protein [Micrococcales bacterium]